MPTVPRSSTSTVNPSGFGGTTARPVFQNLAGATPNAFGAGAAASLQGIAGATKRLVNTGFDIAQKLKLQEDERVAKDLDVQFSKAVRNIGYGTPDAPGFYGSAGENTLRQAPEAEEAINKARQALLDTEGLNGAQKRMFHAASAARVERELLKFDKHTAGQRTVALNNTIESRINEALDDASSSAGDTDIINRSISIVRGEISDQAEINGWSPGVTISKLQEAQTVIYRGAVMSLAQQDPSAAQELYDRVKGQVDGRARREIEKLLSGLVVRARSQAAADGLFAEFPGDVKAQREAARSITNAKLRDEVLKRINARNDERKADAAEARSIAGEARAVRGAKRSEITFGQGQEDRVTSKARQKKADERSDAAEDRAVRGAERSEITFDQGQEDEERAEEKRQLEEDTPEIVSALKSGSAGLAEALVAAADNYEGKTLTAINKALVASYKIDLDIAKNARPEEVQDTILNIARASKNEKGALEAANEIIDPLVRKEVIAGLRASYEDARRVAKEARLPEVQALTKKYRALGLEEAALIAKIREDLDGEYEKEVVKAVELEFNRDEVIRKRSMAEASAEAYKAVWGGQSLAQWAQANPEKFELINGTPTALSALQQAEVTFSRRQQYAEVSDGITLHNLRKMSTRDRSEVELTSIQALLTESEAGTASKLIASAGVRMDAVGADQSLYARADTVLKNFAPKALRDSWNTAKEGTKEVAQRQAAIAEMTAFITSFTDQGKKPSAQDIQKEAVRLMLEISSDPDGLFGGNVSFSGLAAQRNAMSPEQIAEAVVDVDDIPPSIMVVLKKRLKDGGIEETDELLENLAGAVALKDAARIRSILGLRQGTQ